MLLPNAIELLSAAVALEPTAIASDLLALPPLTAKVLSPSATPPLAAKALSPVADVVSIPPKATARLPLAVTQPRATAPP